MMLSFVHDMNKSNPDNTLGEHLRRKAAVQQQYRSQKKSIMQSDITMSINNTGVVQSMANSIEEDADDGCGRRLKNPNSWI